jgi:cyclic pyranopterin phosphate synthase
VSTLTHIAPDGRADMVDVTSKGRHHPRGPRLRRRDHGSRDPGTRPVRKRQKGDVIATARIAGIMAAKKTSDLIPLCHPLALNKVSVEIEPDPNLPGLRVNATARVDGKTGVEMEALTAVSVGLPHHLRHGQGRRPLHDHHRHSARGENRR